MRVFVFITVLLTSFVFSQSLLTDFEGINYTGKKPPDPVIAVGTNHVVLVVNQKIAIYNKDGSNGEEETLQDFFGVSGSIFDPKIVYDHSSDRFLIVAIKGSNKNYYLLAASQTGDPTGGWYKYEIKGSDYSLDFPGLGYDNTTIVLTSHSTTISGNSNDLTILNKNQIYNGNKQYQFNKQDILNSRRMKPARVIGTNSEEFYIGYTQDNGDVIIKQVTNPLGGNPSFSTLPAISLNGPYSAPSTAKQKGENTNLDLTLFPMSISDLVMRDKIIYGAFIVNNSTNNGSAIKYFAIDIENNNNVLHNGTIEEDGIYFYFPVIHPDNNGNMILVFNKSSADDYAGVAYTMHKAGESSHRDIRWLKLGEAGYKNILIDRNRWGDYSGIAMDPSNNNYIWIYGEYAKTTNTWGTWVGKISTYESGDFIFTNSSLYPNIYGEYENYGGTITIDGTTIESGNSIPLELGEEYLATTNNERFADYNSEGYTLKHIYWDELATNNLFNYNFTTVDDELEHHANFEHLKEAKVSISLENSAEASDGHIYFDDPWYLKSNGTQSELGTKYWIDNGGTGYYEPTGKAGATEKGLFLAQGYDGYDWEEPYYSVKVPQSQSIEISGTDHDCKFIRWEANPEDGAIFEDAGNIETKVFFQEANTNIKAIVKGTQLTDDTETLRNSNQRKVFKLGNNYIAVYESLGKIWVEHKAGETGNWTFGNNGQPLTSANAKSPSLGFEKNPFQIIYQEETPNGYAIKISEYDLSTQTITRTTELYETLYNGDYSFDAQPSFALFSTNCLAIWRVEDIGGFADEAGIYYARAHYNNSTNIYEWIPGYTKIVNTTADSKNASVVGSGSPWGYFAHLVWQEGNESIKYQYAEFTNALIDDFQWTYYSEVSEGCGTSINYNPSMVVLLESPLPRVVWIGTNSNIYDDPTKSNSTNTAYVTKRLILRGLQGSIGGTVNWNPQSHKFGYLAHEPLISRAGTDAYVVGWSQNNSKKFITNSSWTIRSFGISGEGFELAYASSVDEVSALTISEPGSGYPNEIVMSDRIDNIIPKTNRIITSTGREGIVYKDELQFFFTVADINLNGTLVEFVDVDEETPINNLDDLNGMLTTKTFTISDNSNLQVSLNYCALNSDMVPEVFDNDDYVDFKLELVDASSNEVLGIYDDVSFTKTNHSEFKMVTYDILTDGVGTRNVILRLVVDENIGASYSLTHLFAENEVISKANRNEISYAGDLEVTEYGLAQNYPNPFNPSTTINYQIPEAGIVTIKIFDILGREVTTLVNEQKAQGVYTVNFNAASLASGVYLYNIQVNDYSATRKMILMK